MKFIKGSSIRLTDTVVLAAGIGMQEDGSGRIELFSSGTGAGVSVLNDLLDTTISSPANGNYLRYNGSEWTNSVIFAADLPSHTHTAPQIGAGVFASGNFQFQGKLIIGTDAPYTSSAGETDIFGLSVVRNVAGGTPPSVFAFGAQISTIDTSPDAYANMHLGGLQILAKAAPTSGNYHEIWGQHIVSEYAGLSATITDLNIGVYSHAGVRSGTATWAVGFEADAYKAAGGSIDNVIGIASFFHPTHSPTSSAVGLATNQYGVRVGPIVSGTLNYAWYSEDGQSYYKDQVVIGTPVAIGTKTSGLSVIPILISGANQTAIASRMDGTTTGTGDILGIGTSTSTANASYTVNNVIGIKIFQASKGTGSTITNQYGLYIEDIDEGIVNRAIKTNTGIVEFGDSLIVGTSDIGGSERVRINGGLRVQGDTTIQAGTFYVQGNIVQSGTSVEHDIWRSDAALNTKGWNWFPTTDSLFGRILTDDRTLSNSWIAVNRTAMTINYVRFPSGTVYIGNPTSSGLVTNFSVGGASSTGVNANAEWSTDQRIDHRFYNTSGGVDAKKWDMSIDGFGGANTLVWLLRNDANVAGNEYIRAVRSGPRLTHLYIAQNSGIVNVGGSTGEFNVTPISFFTDQVQIGTLAASKTSGLFVVPVNITGMDQTAVASRMAGTTVGSGYVVGVGASVATAASAYTANVLAGARIFNATKGAGSTINNQYGLLVEDQDKGAVNRAIKTGSGPVEFADDELLGKNIVMSGTTVYSVVSGISIGGAASIDWSKASIQKRVLVSGTTALSFLDPAILWSGHNRASPDLLLYLKQDATGNRTVTWPATVKWPFNGIAVPTLTTSGTRTDVFRFIHDSGAGCYLGATVGLGYAGV